MVIAHRYARYVFAVLGVLLCRTVLAAGDIKVYIDADPARLSESFQIVFEIDGNVDDSPDFAPLKRDFQILSTSQSSNISVINGSTTSKKSWNLTVLAKRAGKVNIPAINFGSDQSKAITIDVVESSATPHAARSDTQDVFLEVEAKPLNPYVQSQVTYTVRLYRAAATANTSLSDPATEQGDAVIELLGGDRAYETRVNDKSYQVVERRFAVYPQTSGKLQLAPLTFQGQIGNDPFSFFAPFSTKARTIVRQSAPVELDVKPIPKGFTAPYWLPARKVTIQESWSTDPPTFQVGTPITRTLAVTADGLTASQLPELPSWVPAGFQAYPNKPALTNRKRDSGVISRHEEKIAIIPATAGDYVLPAMTLYWWNTATDSLEQARLPERSIHVLAALQPTAPVAPQVESDRDSVHIALVPVTDMPVAVPSTSVSDVRVPRFWMWLSALLGLGWLLTTLAWWWNQHRRAAPTPERASVRPAALAAEIKYACKANDARAAKDALTRWAAAYWSDRPPHSLGEIAARTGGALGEQVRVLDAALYGPERYAWRGDLLWQAFIPARTIDRHGENEPVPELEPLYRL